MDLAPTIRLFHHRWNVPVLSALGAAGGGSRVVVLTRELGVHRDALRAAIDSLATDGWLERNPGYGHPLRPEYVLTRAGERIAPACARFDRLVERMDAVSVAYRKWSAPVLVSLRAGSTRFGALRGALDVTPRALAQGLKALCAEDLVIRNVDTGYPPRPSYRLSRDGARIAGATSGIAEVAARHAV